MYSARYLYAKLDNYNTYETLGKSLLPSFSVSGHILFMTMDFDFTALDLPSVDFSFVNDTLLVVSHLCLFASNAALISLLLTTWKIKMKNPCRGIIIILKKNKNNCGASCL